jgi:membrane protease YdiL (CAAX protease family)
MTTSQKSINNRIAGIAVFYIIALVLRYLTNSTDILQNVNSSFLKYVLQGVGPAIAALVAIKAFGLKTSYSLAGKLKPLLLSVFIFIIIPIIAFGFIGLNENVKTISSPFIAGAKLSLYVIVYSIFEEIGWRGFLQEQLTSINKYVSIVIIATMWFLWHLNFSLTMGNFIFYIILIFAAWGIGKIGDSTKSILAVGAFHAVYNLYSIGYFPSDKMQLVLLGCIIIWVAYMVYFSKKNKTVTA